jgi:hypothetical protein
MVAGVSAMIITVVQDSGRNSIMIQSQGLPGKYLCTTHLTVQFTRVPQNLSAQFYICAVLKTQIKI